MKDLSSYLKLVNTVLADIFLFHSYRLVKMWPVSFSPSAIFLPFPSSPFHAVSLEPRVFSLEGRNGEKEAFSPHLTPQSFPFPPPNTCIRIYVWEEEDATRNKNNG